MKTRKGMSVPGCLPCGIAHGTGNDIACGGR